MLKKIALILIFSLIFACFSGCNSSDDAYLYFELENTPSTLDPQTASTDSELIIIKNVFEGLLRKDDKGNIVEGLAKKYEIKNLTYTFYLRDDAVWSDGTKITASDFLFAFKRALTNVTSAPFVSRLFSIKGAKEYYNGNSSFENVGIKAINDKTLQIILLEDDELFKETLTTSITMPCNEKFFNSTSGKYGLTADDILSCGSYKITKWRKDPFGIRIYKNDKYNGFFEAKNAAVFITCEPQKSKIEKLEKNSIDMTFIDSSLTNTAKELEFEVLEYQNICWVLSIGNDFNQNMRKSFMMLVNDTIYSDKLPIGYVSANSIFPPALTDKKISTDITYNIDEAKKLFSKELNNFQDRKFPTDIKFYYYDNGQIKDVVTSIVGHWQSNLSTFINIEPISDNNLLQSQIKQHTLPMVLFPIVADNTNIKEFLNKFDINYNGENISDIGAGILKSNNLFPIAFQNTVLVYNSSLKNVVFELGNGYIDFAFIIKS